MLLEPTAATRFGLTYRSPVQQNFDNVASFNNLGPGLAALLRARGLLGKPVNMSLTIPQEILISGYQQLNPRFAVMANLGWQNWSAFGKPQLEVSTTSLTLNQHYQDTIHTAIGSQIRVSDPVLLSLGFAYDSSAVSSLNRTLSFNADQQFRFAFGLQYDWSDSLTVGMANEFLDLGSAPASQTSRFGNTVAGDYSTNFVYFVNCTVSKRF